MLKRIAPVIAGSALIAAALTVPARAEDRPILLGINTALQLQVGRDTLDGVRMAVEEINAKGGVLGRKLEVVTADEGESPKEGVAAVNKLTGDNNVNVLIGGYDSGVTLAELPHISRAQTIFLGTGSASPSIQQKVKDDYANYKYLFRVNPINSAKQAASLMDFIKGKLKGDLGYSKISILGENAKWVQDMVPYLKKNATEAGLEVPFAEFFDPQTADFSPIFAKVKDCGLAISAHHPVARRIRRIRQAVVRRESAGADRRHRREEPGRRLLQARRRQGDLGSHDQFRAAQTDHREVDSLVGRLYQEVQSRAGL